MQIDTEHSSERFIHKHWMHKEVQDQAIRQGPLEQRATGNQRFHIRVSFASTSSITSPQSSEDPLKYARYDFENENNDKQSGKGKEVDEEAFLCGCFGISHEVKFQQSIHAVDAKQVLCEDFLDFEIFQVVEDPSTISIQTLG